MIPPAPSIRSDNGTRETSELYWQALCRDVPFSDYERSSFVHQAADALNTKPGTIFRIPYEGILEGPYLSQFLLKPIPYAGGRKPYCSSIVPTKNTRGRIGQICRHTAVSCITTAQPGMIAVATS